MQATVPERVCKQNHDKNIRFHISGRISLKVYEISNQLVTPRTTHIRPLQINSLFPVLGSGIFACGRAVHFHYSL